MSLPKATLQILELGLNNNSFEIIVFKLWMIDTHSPAWGGVLWIIYFYYYFCSNFYFIQTFGYYSVFTNIFHLLILWLCHLVICDDHFDISIGVYILVREFLRSCMVVAFDWVCNLDTFNFHIFILCSLCNVQVEKLQKMDNSLFGEGLTLLGNRYVKKIMVHFLYLC